MTPMFIGPKLASSDYGLKEAPFDLVVGKLEIQLMNMDWEHLIIDTLHMIDRARKDGLLDTLVLHMPFGRHTLLSYVNTAALNNLYHFLSELGKIADSQDLNIGVLFHVDESIFLCSPYNCDALVALHEIAGYCAALTPKLFILLENTCEHYADSLSEYMKRCDAPNVFACFDVCHARAVENMLQRPYTLPPEVAERVKWVHFAAALDGDGYRDKPRTHARMHDGPIAVAEDMLFLKRLGIDIYNVPLIAEICEDDYTRRPDMALEIGFMCTYVVWPDLLETGTLNFNANKEEKQNDIS